MSSSSSIKSGKSKKGVKSSLTNNPINYDTNTNTTPTATNDDATTTKPPTPQDLTQVDNSPAAVAFPKPDRATRVSSTLTSASVAAPPAETRPLRAQRRTTNATPTRTTTMATAVPTTAATTIQAQPAIEVMIQPPLSHIHAKHQSTLQPNPQQQQGQQPKDQDSTSSRVSSVTMPLQLQILDDHDDLEVIDNAMYGWETTTNPLHGDPSTTSSSSSSSSSNSSSSPSSFDPHDEAWLQYHAPTATARLYRAEIIQKQLQQQAPGLPRRAAILTTLRNWGVMVYLIVAQDAYYMYQHHHQQQEKHLQQQQAQEVHDKNRSKMSVSTVSDPKKNKNKKKGRSDRRQGRAYNQSYDVLDQLRRVCFFIAADTQQLSIQRPGAGGHGEGSKWNLLHPTYAPTSFHGGTASPPAASSIYGSYNQRRCLLYQDAAGRLFNLVLPQHAIGPVPSFHEQVYRFGAVKALTALTIMARSMTCAATKTDVPMDSIKLLAWLGLVGFVLEDETRFAWLQASLSLRGCPSIAAHVLMMSPRRRHSQMENGAAIAAADPFRQWAMLCLALASVAPVVLDRLQSGEQDVENNILHARQAIIVAQTVMTMTALVILSMLILANLGARSWQALGWAPLRICSPGVVSPTVAFAAAILMGLLYPFVSLPSVRWGGTVAMNQLLHAGLIVALVWIVTDYSEVRNWILLGSTEDCDQYVVNMVVGIWWLVTFGGAQFVVRRLSNNAMLDAAYRRRHPPPRYDDDSMAFRDSAQESYEAAVTGNGGELWMIRDPASPIGFKVPGLPDFEIDPFVSPAANPDRSYSPSGPGHFCSRFFRFIRSILCCGCCCSSLEMQFTIGLSMAAIVGTFLIGTAVADWHNDTLRILEHGAVHAYETIAGIW